jgi:hypothetical protein
MLFFYHLHIFAVSPILNQPNKTIFRFVSTQRVPYMYQVLVRTRYGYFTIFRVSVLQMKANVGSSLACSSHLECEYQEEKQTRGVELLGKTWTDVHGFLLLHNREDIVGLFSFLSFLVFLLLVIRIEKLIATNFVLIYKFMSSFSLILK